VIREVEHERTLTERGARETARALGLSPRTVDREWAFGRAWLFDRILGKEPDKG